MTKAYLEKRNLEMARHYSDLALEALNENNRLIELMEYYLHQFQIDTTEGNFNLGLANYITFKELSDSLSNSSFKEKMANYRI